MEVRFAIDAWSASGGNLADAAQWLAWAQRPALPLAVGSVPELAWVPAMARRRLGPLGRRALHVAHTCSPGVSATPIVFASRYGDAERSLEMLASMVAGLPVSPTAFGLSVHNAIAAQYSIIGAERGASVSIAGGAASAAAGVFEATALLADGAEAVVLVSYDDSLPGDYAQFDDELPPSYAWAWRIRRPGPATACFGLRTAPAGDDGDGDGDSAAALPFGLDMLRFVLAPDATRLQRRVDGVSWILERHGG